MTINDLKVGMVVTFRNGKKELFDSEKRLNGFNSFFNLDLTHSLYNNLDIIKVEQATLTTIWERKEIKLNEREIEVLRSIKVLFPNVKKIYNWMGYLNTDDVFTSFKIDDLFSFMGDKSKGSKDEFSIDELLASVE